MRIVSSHNRYKKFEGGGIMDFLKSETGQAVVAAGIAGIGDAVSSGKQRKFYEALAESEADRFKTHEGLYKKTLRDLMDTEKYGREEMSVAPEVAEARDNAVTAANMLVDQARLKGEQDTASILNILDSGDPAMAAVAVSQLDDLSGGLTDAKAQALNMANQASAMYGSEAARVNEYNVGVRDDNRARLAALANLELQRGAGGMDPDRELEARMYAAGFNPLASGLGSAVNTFATLAPVKEAKDGMRFLGNEGGITSSSHRGEQFSHEENPIHIVDDMGEKMGELTGGEGVLNPQDFGTVTELVEKGDAKGLLKFLEELLAEPQFRNKEENEQYS